MNIVHVVIGRPKPETSNGVLKSVYNLSLYQGIKGHEVNVLSIRNKPAENSIQVSENVVVHLFERHRLRFVLDRRLVDFISVNFREIDIIHFHGAYHPEYLGISKILNKHNIPYFISPRGGYQKIANRRNYALKIIYKNLFELRVVDRAKKIHALNSQEKDEIQNYGVEASKIIVVPNGVEVENMRRLRNEFSGSTNSNQFSLVYCGRLDAYYKGLDVLVEAIGILVNRRKNSDVHLNLIGPDWMGGKSELERLVSDMKIQNYVTFFGAKFGMDKYKIYSESSVFVLPSRTEGMPTSVLEAMAFAMPCIVTPETNVDKQVSEFGGCIFVKLAPEYIADVVQKLITKKAYLSEMGKKGREWVETYYTYSKVSELHVTNYKKELNK